MKNLLGSLVVACQNEIIKMPSEKQKREEKQRKSSESDFLVSLHSVPVSNPSIRSCACRINSRSSMECMAVNRNIRVSVLGLE